MISKRTLEKWRRETLQPFVYDGQEVGLAMVISDQRTKILHLTQELLDQHLLRKGEGK